MWVSKRIFAAVTSAMLVFDFLWGFIVLQLWTFFDVDLSRINSVAYAQSPDIYTPDNQQKWVRKGGITWSASVDDDFCYSMWPTLTPTSSSCKAHTGDEVTYKVEVLLSGFDTKDFDPTESDYSFSITDTVGEGICNVGVIAWDFVDWNTNAKDNCDEGEFDIEFSKNLFKSENKTITEQNQVDVIFNNAVLVADGIANPDCNNNKIYTRVEGNTVEVYYLSTVAGSTKYTASITPDGVDSPFTPSALSIPTATAIGGNASGKYCYGKGGSIGGPGGFNGAEVHCDGLLDATFTPEYPAVSDLEVSENGTVYAIVQHNSDWELCEIADGDDTPNNCQSANAGDKIVIKNWTAEITDNNQYYESDGKSIESQGCESQGTIVSNQYPELTNQLSDASIKAVGLGLTYPGTDKWFVAYLALNGTLSIYPETSVPTNASLLAVKWTVDEGFVLWGFTGNGLLGATYTLYKGEECGGDAILEDADVVSDYNSFVQADDEDNIIGDESYCIVFEGNDLEDKEISIVRHRLDYYALLSAEIGDTDSNKVVNTISDSSIDWLVANANTPSNPQSTLQPYHEFVLGTGATTFQITKALADDFLATGYELWSWVDFTITIVASWDESTQPLYIIDDLKDSEVLTWSGASVSDIVKTNDNCELDDDQAGGISNGKLTIKLKEGIKTGEDNKCELTITATFTGYGCFENGSEAVEWHYPTVSADPAITIQWSGATVCSTWLQNLNLQKYLIKTWTDYKDVTQSTTDPFYDGDQFTFIVKYNVSGSSNFALHDIVLEDVLTGLSYTPPLTFESNPAGIVAGLWPWELGTLSGGSSGYIVIQWTVAGWTSGTFVNVVKLQTSIEPKEASAIGHYSGQKQGDVQIEKKVSNGWSTSGYINGQAVSFDVVLSSSGAAAFSGSLILKDDYYGLSSSWTISFAPAWCASVGSNAASASIPWWTAGWTITINAQFSGSCTVTTPFFVTVWSWTSTATNTWCITTISGTTITPQRCSAVTIGVTGSWSMSGSACTLSWTLSSGTANFTCTPSTWLQLQAPFTVTVGDGTKSVEWTALPFSSSLSGLVWWSVTLTCDFTYGTNGSGSCTTTLTNNNEPNDNGGSKWSDGGGGWWWEPPKDGNSPSNNGNSPSGWWGSKWWDKGQCKGGACKPKEAKGSDFSPGATVPYSAWIVNNDPEVEMRWIQFWDELPAGMKMYSWKASIDWQEKASWEFPGWKWWRVELTPYLKDIVLPPGKTLDIDYITKIDPATSTSSGANFWQFTNPAANLFECDENGNIRAISWNNNSGNNIPQNQWNSNGAWAPKNNAGGWAENAADGPFKPVSAPLPWPGTGPNAGQITPSPWAAAWIPDLRCEPKLYDISVVKKILTEKIEVGKSLKFEITVKNEGMRTVTWLVLRDKFVGLSNVKITSSTPGAVPWYFSTSTSGEFNILSGATLAWMWTGGSASGTNTITIVVDSILSGTKFVNMVEACGYKDELDPDSDACNGYDKWEDDSAIVSWWVDTAALGDKIRFDDNGDGLQGSWEKWVWDVLVQLIKCGTDVVVWSGVKTNSDGVYSFTNLVPDKYAVRFDISWMKWFALTTKNVGTDDSIDSDGDKIDGKYAISECVTLSGGQSYLWHDIGLTIDFKNLTGLTFLSVSKTLASSGTATAGQEMIFKITVTNDGIMWVTWVSVKDKFVGLSGLKVSQTMDNFKPVAGNDVIVWSGITLGGKPGWLGAAPCTGSNCPPTYGPSGSNQFIFYVSAVVTSGAFSNYVQLCNYDAKNAWAKPPTPKNVPCDNSINQDDDDMVSGGVTVGMIGDLVRNDSDGNGIQTTGEVWVWWVDLELYACANTGTVLKKVKSNNDGSYKFDNLSSGSYIIKVTLGAPNDKYTFSPGSQWSNRSLDSNIKTSTWSMGWTDCVAVSMGSNNTTVDIGLTISTIDIKVDKTTVTQYVNSGDTASFFITIHNSGSGVVKQYTIVDTLSNGLTFNGLNTSDKINYAYRLSGSVTWATNKLQSTCGAPANGRQITWNIITGVMMAANIMPWQSCVFVAKAKVIGGAGSQLNNSVNVSNVPNEINSNNNAGSSTIFAQPVCSAITVSGDVGDAPFDLVYSVAWSNGTVRLLNANQAQITSSTSLTGKFTIQNPGTYYIEYVTWWSTSGTRCMRPIVVKELSECVSLNLTKVNDTTYTALCQGNYATNYKIQLFPISSSLSGNNSSISSATPPSISGWVINWPSGTFTIPMANLDKNYFAVCIVNSGINYSLDKISAISNPSTNQFECPYKTKSDGKICAVNTFVAPLKVNAFDPSIIAQIPDPIEYCTTQETSSAVCIQGAVSAMYVRNYASCSKLITYSLPDLLITKSADKAGFGTGETITWTITVKNIGSGDARGYKVSDKLPNTLRLDSVQGNSGVTHITGWDNTPGTTMYTWNFTDTLAPNQERVLKLTTKLLDPNISELKNLVTVIASGTETTVGNNNSEYIINKQWDSKIGDFVRLDENKNGVQDPSEKGVKDVQVQLVWCNDVSAKLVTKTDANGFYQFIQVGQGSYRVMVQLLDTYRVSPRNIGSVDKDSNIDPSTNLSECFTLANGQIKNDVDAGLFIDPTLPPQNVNCGNSKIEPQYGEQCDGNAVGTDAVCQNCQIIKKSVSICGNAVVEAWEDCEVGNVPSGKTCYNCKLTDNAVCGDGKVSGYEECDINSANKSWHQCIGCIYVPNAFATCGNGRQELGEACDLWSANGTNATIPSGAHQGKRCTAGCNVINIIGPVWSGRDIIVDGQVIGTYEPPSCTEIDPPSAMEWEYFPFWWDIDDSNVVTTCTTKWQVLRDSMSCVFALYAGKWWTTTPIRVISAPCYNVSNFEGSLLSVFNPLANSKYGKHSFVLEPGTINNTYGEYKLRLRRIDYKVCNWTGRQTVNGTVTPFNTFNDSYDETICEYNFTVTRPYLMQIGGLISSNATDSLYNFYGFASNEGTQNILQKYGVQLQSVGLDQYAGSSSLNYLVDTFVDKYNKLSVENISLGANALKVPGKDIFIFRWGNYTYDSSKFDESKPKTIIVSQGDLKIVWNVGWNTLFVVPNGNIVIWNNNCNEAQIINGIYITKNNLQSDTLYVNNNLSNKRCTKGNLEVRWLLIGKWLQDLVSKRRSVLDGWFINNNKKDAVINWASVLIRSNDTLFTNPAPWLEEFTKELNTYKR